jgi:pimeloyl-ACP methyl ester carboxylesterase
MNPEYALVLIALALILFSAIVFLSGYIVAIKDSPYDDLDPEELVENEWNHLGTKIVYYQNFRPHKPSVLLVHGIGACAYSWNRLIPHLSEDFQVYAIDLPGFGKSEIPESFDFSLEAFSHLLLDFRTNVIQNTDCIFVGSSMGGLFGYHIAHKEDSGFKSFVLISPALIKDQVPKIALNPSFETIYFVGARLLNRTLIRLLLKNALSPKTKVSEEDIEQYWLPYKKGKAKEAFYRCIDTLNIREIVNQLKTPMSPTLVINGQYDKQVPPWKLSEFLEDVPNVRHIEHPWGAHHLMEDDPRWVADRIHQV